MHSSEYLDTCTMLGEITLTLLDWSDTAQEDLLLVAMNGPDAPGLEELLRFLDSMRTTSGPAQ